MLVSQIMTKGNHSDSHQCKMSGLKQMTSFTRHKPLTSKCSIGNLVPVSIDPTTAVSFVNCSIAMKLLTILFISIVYCMKILKFITVMDNLYELMTKSRNNYVRLINDQKLDYIHTNLTIFGRLKVTYQSYY